MRGIPIILSLVLSLCLAQGQMHPPGTGYVPALGPVSIIITSPETGPGLGPKMTVGEAFNLSFKIQISNLTIRDVKLQILVFDEENNTYKPFNDDWIIDRENTSFESLRGPAAAEGYFRVRIQERGYYFLKVHANFTIDGRFDSAEGGDVVFGPRIRVIPKMSEASYAVLLGMPPLPLIAGLIVRSARRRATKKRRRRPEPKWLEELKRRTAQEREEVS